MLKRYVDITATDIELAPNANWNQICATMLKTAEVTIARLRVVQDIPLSRPRTSVTLYEVRYA